MTTRKRILRKFVIDSISAVDKPAQEHALATIMKRDDAQEERHGMDMTKITREEPLAFDTLEQAISHLEKITRTRTAAMSEAARRYPDLVKRYNDEGAEIAKAAAEAAMPRSISKAVQDFVTAVDEIIKRDNCSRSEAMIKARAEEPSLFAAYQAA